MPLRPLSSLTVFCVKFACVFTPVKPSAAKPYSENTVAPAAIVPKIVYTALPFP